VQCSLFRCLSKRIYLNFSFERQSECYFSVVTKVCNLILIFFMFLQQFFAYNSQHAIWIRNGDYPLHETNEGLVNSQKFYCRLIDPMVWAHKCQTIVGPDVADQMWAINGMPVVGRFIWRGLGPAIMPLQAPVLAAGLGPAQCAKCGPYMGHVRLLCGCPPIETQTQALAFLCIGL
jgi:hypothetical protein